MTHAVDFVHLADKIVIMNEGKIIAQGSYNELEDHPYMRQIQDIHESNKDELKKANNEKKQHIQMARRQSGEPARESLSEAETLSSDEHGSASSVLSDEEVQDKLVSLAGARLGLDAETEKVVGQLLIDERDEDINADSETFWKLFAMIGGFTTVGIFIAQSVFFRMVEVYQESVTMYWTEFSPEEQQSRFSEYMQTLTYVGLFGLVFGNVRDFAF